MEKPVNTGVWNIGKKKPTLSTLLWISPVDKLVEQCH